MTEKPQAMVRYVDGQGRLTPEGMQYFLTLVRQIDALEARIVALGG